MALLCVSSSRSERLEFLEPLDFESAGEGRGGSSGTLFGAELGTESGFKGSIGAGRGKYVVLF